MCVFIFIWSNFHSSGTSGFISPRPRPACIPTYLSGKSMPPFSMEIMGGKRVATESASHKLLEGPVAAIRSQCWQLCTTSSIQVSFQLRGTEKKKRKKEESEEKNWERGEKWRPERQIGWQRRGKESRRGIKGGSGGKECTGGRKVRELKAGGKSGGRAEEQTAPGSRNANTLQSVAAKGGIS